MSILNYIGFVDFLTPPVNPLTFDEIDSLLDEHMTSDLAASIDLVCGGESADAKDQIAGLLTGQVLDNWRPVGIAMVAAATGKPASTVSKMDSLALGLTALKVIRRQFPTDTVEDSLQAAVTYLVARAGLRSNSVNVSMLNH